MFDTRPISPFGTPFEFPTLEQMICVCLEFNTKTCRIYGNESYGDDSYTLLIKFEDNKITSESLKVLNDFDIKPSDPVTSVDYSKGEWTFSVNIL